MEIIGKCFAGHFWESDSDKPFDDPKVRKRYERDYGNCLADYIRLVVAEAKVGGTPKLSADELEKRREDRRLRTEMSPTEAAEARARVEALYYEWMAPHREYLERNRQFEEQYWAERNHLKSVNTGLPDEVVEAHSL